MAHSQTAMSRFSTVARIWSRAVEPEEEPEEPEAEVAVVVEMLEVMVAEPGALGEEMAVGDHPAEGSEEPERTGFLSQSIRTLTSTVWERIEIR